ncbi:MAG: DUF262 domain-containing HNH endonuclease family protein [Eubacterium sp.]|nr:DUF262 domain-containing HNH endonuclease family protein [Eubacterium sp.]
MDPGKAYVTDVFNGNKKVFIIPLYQRNYSWTKKECLKLFEDILDMHKYKNIKEYFIGTIVYMQHKNDMNYTELTLIDGQQRLTTLSLLLKAISKKFKDNNIEDTNEIDSTYLKLKKASKEEYGYYLKLKPNSKDKDTYEEIMEDKDVTDKSSNLYINYMNFLEWLDKKNHGLSYQDIFSYIENVKLIYIQLGNNDDPQLVFETINSTGKGLMFSDLIRNCILTGLKIEKQDALYLDYWKPLEETLGDKIEDFIRSYLQIKVKKVFKKKETYNTFRNFYEPRREEVDQLLEEMLEYAKIFAKLEEGYEGEKELEDCCMAFKFLNYKLTYPFVMRLIMGIDKDNIKLEDVVKIINTLVSFVLRKTTVQTNLTQQFASLMVEMYSNIENSDDIYRSFLRILFEQDSSKLKFVDDNEFYETLVTRDIYKTSFADYLLKRIENNRSKEKTDYSNVSKDHIMPQTPNEEWKKRVPNQEQYEKYKHRLGNLTLTSYNSEKRNNAKDIYSKSKISLNKDIDIDKWDIECIKKRGASLAEECLSIWKYPDISGIDFGKPEMIFISIDSIDSTDVSENNSEPEGLKINDEKYELVSWKEVKDSLVLFMRENYKDKDNIIDSFEKTDIMDFEKVSDSIYSLDENLKVSIALQ